MPYNNYIIILNFFNITCGLGFSAVDSSDWNLAIPLCFAFSEFVGCDAVGL